MLVYGDPKFCLPSRALIGNFQAHLAQCNPSSLDDLRSLLIEAGQLEQAVADAATDHQLITTTTRLTDSVAAIFCLRWMHGVEGSPAPAEPIAKSLNQILGALSANSDLANTKLTVKVPEGFAFYALFPEQYCATALTWAQQHFNSGQVIVVGIRSIGTTLSSVVKETLLLAGWDAKRITVRPTGHPFQRRVELNLPITAADRVLVVDEGPGISGSSMAAVAQACESKGAREISFLPGHGDEPGASASEEIRALWQRTPRYITPLKRTKWNGLSLEQSLAAETQKFGSDGPVATVEDVSAGQWRKFAFQNETNWPASAIQFERTKYLCLRHNATSVLWKFAGLHCNHDGQSASDAALARLSLHASAGFGPAPLGAFRGFVALPWLDGKCLTRADAADALVLHRIGRYIIHAAGPDLSDEEQIASIDRLAEMSYWNVREALGETIADQTRALGKAARRFPCSRSSGDGHLMPHEWLRTSSGLIMKVDAEGHSADHTLIGPQSLLWDIAGALTEWDLGAAATSVLLSILEKNGTQIQPEALLFFQQAYAAFRMGLLSLSIDQTSDTREKSRLRHARDFYQAKLARLFTGQSAPVGIAG
jgi:hypothetical protein